MKPPIFVWEPGTIEVFSTKENAEAYLEADIVAEYSFTAYDSEGFQLEIAITPDRWVEIRPMVPSVNKADELSEILRDFLRRVEGVTDNWLSNASLDELTTKALVYADESLAFSWSEWFSPLFEWLKRIFRP